MLSIWNAGARAFAAGLPCVPPYTRATSGVRWRTFANTWAAGWMGLE